MRIVHVQGYQPAFSTIHSAPYLHAYMVFTGTVWIAMWAADPEMLDIFEIHSMFLHSCTSIPTFRSPRLYGARFGRVTYSLDPTQFARIVSCYVYENMSFITLLFLEHFYKRRRYNLAL